MHLIFNKFMSSIGGAQGAGNIIGSVIGGIQQIGALKKQKKTAETAAKVAGVVNQAARLPQEQITRKYIRPEDSITDANQRFPTYGVGTNYLSRNGSMIKAQDGSMIGGNPTEIQNTYNPGDLYEGLGYEPLNDSDKVKQYIYGGFTPRAEDGYNAGSQLSSFINDVGGSGNPISAAVNFGTFAIKDNLKRSISNFQDQAKSLNQSTAFMNAGQGLHGQYSQFMENGGWMSHDWQPQVISQFDGHPIKSLLTKDPMMDTLRTGGHISQNNIYPQDQYNLGGELKTTWGGYAEPMSHNPYMPGTGETVMFRGKSHEEGDGNGHTGIGVKYGDGGHDSYTDYAEYGTKDADADVEVERGEPALEMTDPQTGEKNMVVYGNLMINKGAAKEIGDPKAAGKKYKNYVADLAKIENKQNKIIEKSTNQINNLDVHTSFDKLKMDALKASITGANMKLKDIATKKTNASIVQNATNETAEEHGLDADAFARGKIKIDKEAMKQKAKYGKELFRAQTGTQEPSLPNVSKADYDRLKDLYEKAKKAGKGPAVEEFQKEYYKVAPDYAEKIIRESKPSNLAINQGYKTKADLQKLDRNKLFGTNNNIFGDRTKQFFTSLNVNSNKPNTGGGGEEEYTGEIPLVDINLPEDLGDVPTTTTQETTKKKGFDWMSMANQILPYLRPSDQEPFDQSQLYPELYALATNKVEPVQAQLYNPELDTPYDISLQDQMNANQADFNAIQRQSGYNPEASATLAAQKYAANSKILGEQFRMNQGMKAGVYGKNRDVLNDAKLKNLGILDQQFVRQETAKSRAKDVAQAALNSMASKIAQNKLENRTLGIYENMYNYRFGKDGRAQNWNPLAQFNTSVDGTTSKNSSLPSLGDDWEWDTTPRPKKKKKDADENRNGSIVKAIKNL
ncbi:MAG: hypothetical protein EB127_01400 [Alphaproteobacteria bacterium]|nr:hypothetical protein [Alphaproteobacteria bacterium]